VSEFPDYIQPVAGVRIWRVAPNLWAQLGGLLWAPGIREPWPTGEEFEAACNKNPDHVQPAEGCMCGIYAFYSPNLAIAGDYWPKSWRPNFNRLVAGVVGAAGDVVLHEWGWRASHATVVAIFGDFGGNIHGAPDSELPMPRQEIADAYDASVISVSDYKAFCECEGLIVFSPEDF
jgi:hypothetical protein